MNFCRKCEDFILFHGFIIPVSAVRKKELDWLYPLLILIESAQANMMTLHRRKLMFDQYPRGLVMGV